MIERLLEADRLLAIGLLDQAERIYWLAAELDRQNAMAVVGLARVALEKGDDRTALQFGRKALEIDPESPAARRLVARVEEVMAQRGEDVPALLTGEAAPEAAPAAAPEGPPATVPTPYPEPPAGPVSPAGPVPPTGPAAGPKGPGRFSRLFGGR